MTYAVKTLENLFTWCGHERYISNDDGNLSIIKSYMKVNKCGNVV